VQQGVTRRGETGVRAILRCPAGPELARQAAELAAQDFGRDMMPAQQLARLRAKNPSILACLTSVQGGFLGYFDVIPFKPDFAQGFLSGRSAVSDLGKATGRTISPRDIFGAEEMAECKDLYIAGIAVLEPHAYSGRRHASMLVWGFWKYMQRFYPPVPGRQVFAVAETPEGASLLKRFNFALRTGADETPDKHPLYILALSRAAFRHAFRSLPDWKGAVRMDLGRPEPR
jgi:hypothetical protein